MYEQTTTAFPHEKLEVYRTFLSFAAASEMIILGAGTYAVADQLERATESVGANLIRGNSQWTAALRVASFDVALASSLECAACLDVCLVKGVIRPEQVTEGKGQLHRIVGMLFGLRKSSSRVVREDEPQYGPLLFGHERLDVYRLGLDFVRWADVFLMRGTIKASEVKKLDAGSTSIVLNIAEGNGKFAHLDHAKFVGIAHTAALQCVLVLDLMVARGRCAVQDVREGKEMLRRICAMLLGWRKRLVEPTTEDCESIAGYCGED